MPTRTNPHTHVANGSLDDCQDGFRIDLCAIVSAMTNITTEDEAQEIVMGYDGHVATQDVSSHRWYTKQLVVYQRDGDLLGFHYLKPATEEQEGMDCFDAVPVPVFPVVAREVVQTIYEAA